MSDIDALAEGLLAALNETGYSLQHEYADSGVYDVAPALAAAPPVAALLARAALADELAGLLARYAPDLPPEAPIRQYGSDRRCDSCNAPIVTERGPSHRGLSEWAKDRTEHKDGCRWIAARAALAKWEASKPRDPWQEAVDSPEMPGPGYDAQTRPLR